MSRVRPFVPVLFLGLALVVSGCSAGPDDPGRWWGLPAASPSPAPQAPMPSLTPTPAPVTANPVPTTPTTRPPSPPPTSPPTSPPPSYSSAGTMHHVRGGGVALTFDDGPDPVYTPQLLDLLRRHRVRATFCLVGWRAEAHPQVVRRIAAEGHTLCNHSWAHEFSLATWTNERMRANLQATNDAIRRAVPRAKIRYFRAPGGNFNSRLIATAKAMGMTSVYWSVDTRDWDAKTYGAGEPMVRHINYVVQHNARPGSIVLSHDLAKPDTIAAYRTLLPWLKGHYRLVPLPS